jgi:hypothetical protein
MEIISQTIPKVHIKTPIKIKLPFQNKKSTMEKQFGAP